ncbi:hypothetical protein AVENP_0156 [Arcobacter venerupis]|uniref:Uncharacterized protein n=1 Tax=Arcobacter venerupis TaxID=1054033 RepID=A0AAE7B6Y1_9BACT|nr:hypothetical protein [Arcobacter venerupis]QKF65736.1 hypothetical protein AVENP_0156 [Arcobacter venerupis]RWS50246.1 hypothetical protein CKA56_04745 [Arcobacter venerupis]
MKKILIIFFIFFSFSFSLELNLNNFEDRQAALRDVKTLILYEESIAKAYEEYILTNYSIPTLTQITSLIENISLINPINSTFTLDGTLMKISYGLIDEIKADSSIKALYESNTYRKRTFFRNDKISFILEDEFAKHLYDLIKQSGEIINCPTNSGTITKVNCKQSNHIYIGVTNIKKDTRVNTYEPDVYLMVYSIDKFKTGPIVITADSTEYTQSEFDSIPKGALLYDVVGVKYVKTIDGIKALK